MLNMCLHLISLFTFKDIYFASTGAYICEAENSAGKRLDIASLVVIDDETPSTGAVCTHKVSIHSLHSFTFLNSVILYTIL